MIRIKTCWKGIFQWGNRSTSACIYYKFSLNFHCMVHCSTQESQDTHSCKLQSWALIATCLLLTVT